MSMNSDSQGKWFCSIGFVASILTVLKIGCWYNCCMMELVFLRWDLLRV